ncbi:unnamed protein product, partial [Ectocarpus sp. 4 AP-2014]
ALFSAGTCTEFPPALTRAPGTTVISAKTALLRAGKTLITAGLALLRLCFIYGVALTLAGANRARNGWTLLLSEVLAYVRADLVATLVFVVCNVVAFRATTAVPHHSTIV